MNSNLSIQDAAQVLGVNAKTLRRWEASGILIPARTPGGQRRYSLEQIKSFRKPKRKVYFPLSVTPITPASTDQGVVRDFVASTLASPLLPSQRVILAGAFLLLTLSLVTAIGFKAWQFVKMDSRKISADSQARLPAGQVLAAESINPQYVLKVTVPTEFTKNITAPNITYTVSAGEGIEVTGGQNPVVSLAADALNVDAFGTVTLGATSFSASGEDTLTFAAGSNVSISMDTIAKKLTISSTDTDTDSTGGWTDDGANVRLSTAADTVTLGSSLIISDGGLIDLSAVLHDDSAPQGIKLPQNTSLTAVSSGEGFLAYDSDDNLVMVFDGTTWTSIGSGGSGDITAVGSMTSGDAFADATADDDWLGLGAAAGRIEFDDLATDEVNILGANVGIGDTDPAYLLTVGSGDLFGIDGAANTSLLWEGSGADTFETALTVVNPTADLIYRLADAAAGTYDLCSTVGNCLTGGAAATLQTAYNAGNTITTTTARDIEINLAELATDTTFQITQAGTGGVNAFEVHDDGTFSDTTPFIIDQSGNVGIGTTSPDEPFHVAEITDGGFSTVALFENSNPQDASSTEGVDIRFAFGGDNDVARIAVGELNNYSSGAASDSYMAFYTDIDGTATQVFTLRNRVAGLGTTAPDAALEINHATGDSLRLTYNDADGSATAYTDFSLGSDGDLTIDSAGGNIILSDDLAINADDLTTNQTTFNLINTTATTLNLGGAATTLNIAPTGASGSIVMSGGSADTGCTLDGTTGNFTCSGAVSGSSGAFASTLQNAYDNDANGSDTIIALTANDDSLVFSNPTSAGTDADFVLHINQQNTTDTLSALDITQASNAFDAVNIVANSLDAENIVDVSGTGLTTGNGINVALTESTLAGGFYFRAFDNSAAATVFSVGEDGATTITGLEGSNMLTVTAGDAVISDGSLSITDDDNAAGLVLTNNTLTTYGAGSNTAGLAEINSTTLSTGKLLNLSTGTANALSTGTLLNVYSSSTALTTGNLALFDWSPTPSATASGDLVRIKIGTQGDITGNLFNILSDTTSLFSVSETVITNSLPAAFNATGDVTVAYDLVFTNQIASFIKSNAPLYFEAGETFENNNLTLRTYGTGDVVFDFTGAGGDFTIDAASMDNTSTTGVIDLNVDSITTNNIGLNIDYISQSGVTGAADLFAAKINLLQNDTDGDLFGLWIDNNATATTIAGTNLVDCLLCLNNSENQAAAVLNAIYIASSGATAGSITNGLNIATTDVTTDIILQNAETIDNNVDGQINLHTGTAGVGDGIYLDSGATTSTANGLCHSGADVDNAVLTDVQILACAGTVDADFAEQYPVAQDVELGDLVAIGTKEVTTTGGNVIRQLIKTSHAYQNSVIGVVSNNYSDFASAGYDIPNNENPKPIALVGRVMAKVSTENGPVQVGDPITTSSIPGVGMKSTNPGFIIGRSLATYANADPSAVGSVMVYINASWADPNNQLTFDASGNLTIPEVIAGQDAKVGSLVDSINDRLSTINNQFASVDNQIASISAELASLKLSIDPAATMSGPLDNYWSVATESGKLTTIYDIQATSMSLTGKLSVGLLAFDDIDASISSLTGEVTIAGDLAVTGNMQVLGDSIGEATIAAGETEVIVTSSAAAVDSRFFATPEIYALPIATEATSAGEFVIRLPFAIPDDLKVNWWIIN